MSSRVAFAATKAVALAALALVTLVGTGSDAAHQLDTDGNRRGRVVWAADAERPLADEWASLATDSNCATLTSESPTDAHVRRVTAPRAQGRYAYRFDLEDGDECYGERAEVGQGNPGSARTADRLFRENDERWISWQLLLPSGFPEHTPKWQALLQWKQVGALGTPVLSLDVHRGRWWLNTSNSNGDSDRTHKLWSGCATRRRWVRFTMHVRFSPNRSIGFVELFGDLEDGGGMRRLLGRTPTWTLKVGPSGTAVPSHARIGIYRNPMSTGDATAYYDGYVVATSRNAAERRAFAP